jgi:DNA-binding transcriptional LysR family regulator
MQFVVVPLGAVAQSEGIEFEELRTYPLFVALPGAHRLARHKSIPLEKFAAEPLIALRRKFYPGHHQMLDRVFAPLGVKPQIAVECDTASSMLTAIEAGGGIALASAAFKQVTGNRLVYRPLTGTKEVLSVGIARFKNSDVTPAGEKFCEILRRLAKAPAGNKTT